MNIGLVAHDAKKILMQNFCIAYRGILSKNTVYATDTTGRLIEEVTNLNVCLLYTSMNDSDLRKNAAFSLKDFAGNLI